MQEAIYDVGKIVVVLVVSRNTENVGIVVAACLGGIGWGVADGGADSFEAIRLHGDTLSRSADENTESLWLLFFQNRMCDLFGVIIIIILGVVIIGPEVSAGDGVVFEPVENTILELKTAMVGAEEDMHISTLDPFCQDQLSARQDGCYSPIRYRTKRQP